jgi:AraC-like DNA-binding protein
MQRRQRANATRAAATDIVTVQRMVDLIEKAYAERITLHTVSTAVRGVPHDLGRLFRKVTGATVHEYVTRVRLEHAAHLIAGNVKVEAVALGVGYRSKKNFYRQFARLFGVTPDAFRRGLAAANDRHTEREHSRPRGRGAWNGKATYEATFEQTPCIIDVEVRQNVKGRTSFVATPYVFVFHGLQPFAAAAQVEIGGETEAEALERAAVFLEQRFGTRLGAPRRQNGESRTLPIRTPRR